MTKTISELYYLLSVLDNMNFHYLRSFNQIHKDYFSYPTAFFNHDYRGRRIIELLTEIEYDAILSDSFKSGKFYSENFSKGKCVIIDDNHISFHCNLSQALFCKLAQLLEGDIRTIIDVFRENRMFQYPFYGALNQLGYFSYHPNNHDTIWAELRPSLINSGVLLKFLNSIGQYLTYTIQGSMELKLTDLEILLNDYLSNYNFENFVLNLDN